MEIQFFSLIGDRIENVWCNFDVFHSYPSSERKDLLKISIKFSQEWDYWITKGGIIERNSIWTREGCVIWLFIRIETVRGFNTPARFQQRRLSRRYLALQSHLCLIYMIQEFFKSQFESAQPNEELRKLIEERLTRFKIFYDAQGTEKKLNFAFETRVSSPNANAFVFEASLEFIPNVSFFLSQ